MNAWEDVALQFGGAFTQRSDSKALTVFAVLDGHRLGHEQRTDVASCGVVVFETDGSAAFVVPLNRVLANARHVQIVKCLLVSHLVDIFASQSVVVAGRVNLELLSNAVC